MYSTTTIVRERRKPASPRQENGKTTEGAKIPRWTRGITSVLGSGAKRHGWRRMQNGALLVLLGLSLFRYMSSVANTRNGEHMLAATTKGLPPLQDSHIRPTDSNRQCAALRFGGSGDSAKDVMKPFEAGFLVNRARDLGRPLNVGLEFVEDPSRFSSLSGYTPKFHLFHFLEFLVVAFSELQRLVVASDESTSGLGWTGGVNQSDVRLLVPWIYTPHMAVGEICNFGDSINCVIADLVLNASLPAADGPSITSTFGLEANDDITQGIHPAMVGPHVPAKGRACGERKSLPKHPLTSEQRKSEREKMLTAADAVLLIYRHRCNKRPTKEMWEDYIDSFPATRWHSNVRRGLNFATPDAISKQQTKKKLVVGYIDRQNRSNRRMADADHAWLVGVLSKIGSIDFLHLRMEDFSGAEQIFIASSIDVLIGLHGNGLSHVLWMQPGSYVVEIFWNSKFLFDYATASQMMQHRYLNIFNGKITDADRIAQRDPTLRHLSYDVSNLDGGGLFTYEAKVAIMRVIKDAIKAQRRKRRFGNESLVNGMLGS